MRNRKKKEKVVSVLENDSENINKTQCKIGFEIKKSLPWLEINN